METLDERDRTVGTWKLLAHLFEHSAGRPGLEHHPFEPDILIVQDVLLDAVIPAGLMIRQRHAYPFRYPAPDPEDLVGTGDDVAWYVSSQAPLLAVQSIARTFHLTWTDEVNPAAAAIRVMAGLLHHARQDGLHLTWRKMPGWHLGPVRERNLEERLAEIPANPATRVPADRVDVWLLLPWDYIRQPPEAVLAAVHLDGGVWAGPELGIFSLAGSLLDRTGSPPVGVQELWEAGAPPMSSVCERPSQVGEIRPDDHGSAARKALLDGLARRGLLTAPVRRGLRKLLLSRIETMEGGLADDAAVIRNAMLSFVRCLASSKPDPVGPTGVVFRGYGPLDLPRIDVAPGEADLPSGPPKIDAIVESCVQVAREDLAFLQDLAQRRDLFDSLSWDERVRWVHIERHNGWYRLIELT